MAGTYRHQTLIEAPIEDVWAVVSDPRTHRERWPDVVYVQGGRTPSCSPRVMPATGGYVRVITSRLESADTVV
jgi:uncharacterized protein YndB with AHSA1/START domain